MIARSIDRCAINGSIDGAAQSMDRANPSIARNNITFHIPIWNQHSCPCLDVSDKHCLDPVHDLLGKIICTSCRLPAFSQHSEAVVLLSSPRDPIASRAFRICACVVISTTETVSIEMASTALGGTSRWTVTVSSMRNLVLTALKIPFSIWRNERSRKLRFVNFWMSFRGTFHRECMAFLQT